MGFLLPGAMITVLVEKIWTQLSWLEEKARERKVGDGWKIMGEVLR